MLDVNVLTLVSGTLLPMLVALVTARVASGSVKSLTLAFLSAVAGVVTELVRVDGVFGAVDWNGAAGQSVVMFLIAVGVHFGLLKPTGVTGSAGTIQSSVTRGIGYRGRHARSD